MHYTFFLCKLVICLFIYTNYWKTNFNSITFILLVPISLSSEKASAQSHLHNTTHENKRRLAEKGNRSFSSSPGPLYQNEVKCSGRLIWKWFFILTQIKLVFTRKVVHLASFWRWGFLELGSGLLELRTNNGGMNAYRFFRQQAKRQLKLASKIHVKSEIFSSRGNKHCM